MKLTTLFEDTNSYKMLEQECSSFLNGFKESEIKHVLLRGTTSNIKKVEKVAVRKDRKPLNTSSVLHDIADAFFFKKFGIKARSNAAFCTPSRKQAKIYGIPSIVIPVGDNYTFIYSSKISDLFDDVITASGNRLIKTGLLDDDHSNKLIELLDNYNMHNLQTLSDKISANTDDYKSLASIFLHILSNCNYVQDSTLSNVKILDTEIMLICDETYLVPETNDTVYRLEFEYGLII